MLLSYSSVCIAYSLSGKLVFDELVSRSLVLPIFISKSAYLLTDLKCTRAYPSSGEHRWSDRPGFLVAEKRGGAGVLRVKDVSSVGRRSLGVGRRRRLLLVLMIIICSGRGGPQGPG